MGTASPYRREVPNRSAYGAGKMPGQEPKAAGKGSYALASLGRVAYILLTGFAMGNKGMCVKSVGPEPKEGVWSTWPEDVKTGRVQRRRPA